MSHNHGSRKVRCCNSKSAMLQSWRGSRSLQRGSREYFNIVGNPSKWKVTLLALREVSSSPWCPVSDSLQSRYLIALQFSSWGMMWQDRIAPRIEVFEKLDVWFWACCDPFWWASVLFLQDAFEGDNWKKNRVLVTWTIGILSLSIFIAGSRSFQKIFVSYLLFLKYLWKPERAPLVKIGTWLSSGAYRI